MNPSRLSRVKAPLFALWFVLAWGVICLIPCRCPDSGRQIARSTGSAKQREAERAAAKWEAELREGRYNKPTKTTWQDFRHQYDRNV